MARHHTPVPPPPPVAPRPVGEHQPHWTVAFPTYNVDEALFEKALRSVLDQDPGPDRMQILIVDDCSPGSSLAESIGQRLSPGRIEFFRNERNLGLAGNWNRCIALARGRWIHLLHQDDLLGPGFYERLERADREAPDAGAAFTRYSLIDLDGHWTWLGELERPDAGILEDWLSRIITKQRIQCASIAVRRSTYESIGGYRPDLKMALDWEMWVRIATQYPVWYEPAVLAHFRLHPTSETVRLRKLGETGTDLRKGVCIVRQYVPPQLRWTVGRDMLHQFPVQLTGLAAVADRVKNVVRDLTPPLFWRILQSLRRSVRPGST